jgi:4'-phosphopantetheinyl transferase
MKAPVQWSSPRETPELASGEIHIWRASLATDQAILRNLESKLTEDEKARAARFVFARDRKRFIAARGILRDLLGRYLQCAPQTIEFVYGPRGKPAVVSRGSQPAIGFNLSHSHALAVIAFGRGREIGIDIELIRPEFAGEEIAKRYFSAKEIDELGRLPAELRTEGFFTCWTRKEAYIKARGDGLHIALDSFDVLLSPGSRATLSSADESRWSIESFVPSLSSEPTYAGAVVAEGRDWTARYFEWKHLDRETLIEE